MWPFKHKPAITTEEYAATRPPAPCGEQTKHVFWTEIQGMKCPICAGKEKREQQEQDENRMAGKIAAEVVRQMAELPN
jgi:hypothetical protein